MDLNKKEKFIKEALSNEKHDLDTHALWNSIQPRVESKDKDRKWIIFFFLGAMSMGAVWMLFNVYGTDFDQPVSVENTIAPIEKNLKFEENIPTQTILEQENTVTVSQEAEEYQAPAIINTPTSNEISNDLNAVGVNEVEYRNSNNQTTKIIASIQPETTNTNEIESRVSENETIGLLAVIETENETSASSSLDRSLVNISSIKALNNIGIQTNRILDLDLQTTEVIKPHRNFDWIPFVQFHAGGIKTTSHSEILSNEATLNATAFDKESGVYGYSSTLNLGWERNDGWYYGLGIDFTQSAVRYQNTDTVLETESTLGVNAIYINRDGQTTAIPGTVSENMITNYDISWYRQHRHINFEILIGKRLIEMQKFSLSVDAGLLYGLSQSHTGYYFEDAPNGFKKIENNSGHNYTDSGNMKMRSALSFNYNLNQFSLGLQAIYRHDLNGITKSSNFYKTRNTDFGLRLGLTYFPKW